MGSPDQLFAWVLVVAGRLRGFPLPRWDGIGLRPQAILGSPRQFFHIFQGLIADPFWVHPGQSLFDQLMSNVPSICKQNVGGQPALPIPFHIPYNDFTVGNVGGRGMFSLLPIRLLQFRAVNTPKMDDFSMAFIMNCQAVSVVDDQDSSEGLGQSKRRRNYGHSKRQACCDATHHHDCVCYRQRPIQPIISEF